MKEKENQWVTLEASWPQAPSRTPMGCPAGVKTFTRAPNIVPIKTGGGTAAPRKAAGPERQERGLDTHTTGLCVQVIQNHGGRVKRKGKQLKAGTSGQGPGGCTTCLFHCCFVFEFLFGDNRSTMLLVSAAQQRGSAVGIHMPLPLGLPPQPTHPWVSTEHPEELCAARRFLLTAYPHALLYKRQG